MNRRELHNYYESDRFKTSCIYRGGELGAVHTPDFTRFKLWSPLADRVFLNFYQDGQTKLCDSVVMSRREKGVWEYELRGDCHGIYYDFIVETDGRKQRTADPYARACSCNGARSMAVDLRRTDPDGWEQDRAPEKTEEQIICEVHVKDFSNDPSCGIPRKWRGKYKAFTADGTTLNNDGEHPTCLAYLKRLGVTHVQLMPVFDFASVDESAGSDTGSAGSDPDGAEKREPYNWGYDPLNFNVPEGSYATDPFHGEVRILELKELVMALHRGGIRVIMDVVYNHTYSRDSWFERTVPGYYYRRGEDGTWSDGSACGNDFASEREMAADYILESVLYWAEEYHIDGFRFDLMGLLDTALMNRIRHALDEKFGFGEILLYGEPWRAGFSEMGAGSIPCLKENLCLLDEGIGVFCDATRDVIKGHVFQKEVPGFVNGGRGLEADILRAVRAWTDHPNEERAKMAMKENMEFQAKSPSQIINYVSAHDNLTLWDKLMVTLKPGKSFIEYDRDVVRANKMAAAVCCTCQGRLFFLLGEEAARTKRGDENSYRSSPAVNQLDWRRMYDYGELMEYYRGLIAFRKQMPGLCDKSAGAGKRIFDEEVSEPGCAGFCVDNREHERWDMLAVRYNGTQEERETALPFGEWDLLIDGDDSWRWAEPQMKRNSGSWERKREETGLRQGKKTVRTAPVSVTVFGRRAEK